MHILEWGLPNFLKVLCDRDMSDPLNDLASDCPGPTKRFPNGDILLRLIIGWPTACASDLAQNGKTFQEQLRQSAVHWLARIEHGCIQGDMANLTMNWWFVIRPAKKEPPQGSIWQLANGLHRLWQQFDCDLWPTAEQMPSMSNDFMRRSPELT